MYSLQVDRITLRELVTHWSRDLRQHPPVEDLITVLLRSFWAGELSLYSPLSDNLISTRHVLEAIDDTERPKDRDAAILVGPSECDLPPQFIDNEDGSTTVDLRARLLLPVERPWPDHVVKLAEQAMAQVEWDSYPDALRPLIMMCCITKEEFFRYCAGSGYARPAFWSDPGRSEDHRLEGLPPAPSPSRRRGRGRPLVYDFAKIDQFLEALCREAGAAAIEDFGRVRKQLILQFGEAAVPSES